MAFFKINFKVQSRKNVLSDAVQIMIGLLRLATVEESSWRPLKSVGNIVKIGETMLLGPNVP